MEEILDDVSRWRAMGLRIALARVVKVGGSAPRLPGAVMAVSDDGQVSGSVSGGCVEGAVVSEALSLLQGGGTGRVLTFGYSDDDAFAVGLTCGGTLSIFIEEPDCAILDRLASVLSAQRTVALATIVDGPGTGLMVLVHTTGESEGSLGDSGLTSTVVADALAHLETGRSELRHYGTKGEARADEVTVFIESFAAPPRMLIFGAVDFTGALVRVAKVLGYVVTVCDARAVFATRERFPSADEVLVDWPHRLLDRVGSTLGARDAVCVLTHDHKFDVPAIVAALRTNVGYLGAMGSRRTTAERRQRLLDAGVTETEMARLRAPVGLDIGARTPEETAVSICAEVIASRAGRTASSLTAGEGPIHPDARAAVSEARQTAPVFTAR